MSDTLETLIRKLIAALEREDFDEAIEICSQIINHPDAGDEIKADTLLNRANSYDNKGEYDRAIQDYDKAIELNPNDAEAYNNRGVAYENKEEYDRAIQDFDKAIELNPNDAEAYRNRGIAYEHKEEHDRAIQDFDKAIELDPNDAEAYRDRGIAYEHKEEFDRAIKDYDKAIELNPKYIEAYNNRGIAYGNKKEYDRAIQDFDKATELNPNDTIAYYNRGIVYERKNEHGRAIQNYSKIIEINPKHVEAYNSRGIAYNYKGEYDKAIQDFDKVIELKSNYAKAYNNRGTAYANKNEYGQAIQNYDKAIKINPNDAEIYFNRGVAYRRKGEHDRAIQDYDKAIEIKPNYAKAIHNRAIAMAYKDAERIQQQISDEHKKELKEQIKKQQEKFDQELKSQVGELIDYYKERWQDCRERLEGKGKGGENEGLGGGNENRVVKILFLWLFSLAGSACFVAGLFILITAESPCRFSSIKFILTIAHFCQEFSCCPKLSCCQALDCCHATYDTFPPYAKLFFTGAGIFILPPLLLVLWQLRQIEGEGLKKHLSKGVMRLFVIACVVYPVMIGLYIMFPLNSSGAYGVIPFIFVGTLILSPLAWNLRVLRQEIREESILREDAHTNYVLSIHMNNSRFNAPNIHEDLLKQFFDHHDKRGSAQLIASLGRPTEKSNDGIVQTITGYTAKTKEQVKSPPPNHHNQEPYA